MEGEEMLIAGPSHVQRLEHAIRVGQVAAPRGPLLWLHSRGEAISSPFFQDAEFARGEQPAVCLVGDFRLGNKVLLTNDPRPGDFRHISSELIGPENDLAMFQRSMAAVERIRRANPLCRFMFWSLAGREYSNRRRGQYMTDGVYRHPTWNLSDVEDSFDRSVIRLGDVIDHPFMQLLHVDDSSHPTHFGYELLRRLIDDPYRPTVDVFDDLYRSMSRPVVNFDGPTVLTGPSIWVRVLKNYVDQGLVRFGDGVEYRSPDDLLALALPLGARIVFCSAVRLDSPDLADRTARQRGLLDKLAGSGNLPVALFWEHMAEVCVGKRRDDSLQLGASPIVKEFRDWLPFIPGSARPVQSADVELGNLAPSFQGLLSGIRMAGGYVTWESLP